MAIRKEVKTLEGIVIRTVDFKDNDQIVELITRKGRFSFLARGTKKVTSKNASSLLMLTKGKYTLFEGIQGGLSLKEATIERTMSANDDIDRIFALNFLGELLRTFTNELTNFQNVYEVLDETLKNINEGFDPLSACLLFFAKILKENGIALDVSKCVRCQGKRNIVGLSYADGGFICKNDIQSESERKSAYELKVIRFAFLAPIEKMGTISFAKKTALSLLREWGDFVEYGFGVKIASLKFLSAF